jgi:secreted Zn-dependent insulinase-like peptidase
MKCILIEDKEADKSAASLDVMVGCSLDPKPLYGTAHFLEHMLFMGT